MVTLLQHSLKVVILKLEHTWESPGESAETWMAGLRKEILMQ